MLNEKELLRQHNEILTGRWVTDLANTSAFIFTELKNLNWAGFYLLENSKLYLGPFQGKPACTVIEIGKGVCGTSAQKLQTLIVPDVHAFPGHIACDSASRSEIVIPLIRDGQFLGVLDVDSPLLNRFTNWDQNFFENLVKQLLEKNP